MVSGNKGEWSEIYVFLKVLEEGKLYAADKYLEKIRGEFYPVLAVIRWNNGNKLKYKRNDIIKVINVNTNMQILEVPVSEFKKQAKELLKEIKAAKGRTFEIKKTEEFLNNIKVFKIKKGSRQTKDITIKIHDINTGLDNELGFSIKSQLGSASSLLNASSHTNFIYKIEGMKEDPDIIKEINNIKGHNKIKDRIKKIKEYGGTLKFKKIVSEVFSLNLELIDSNLPVIMSYMLVKFFSSGYNKLKDIVGEIRKENVCNFNLNYGHPFYSLRVKNFLASSALGLTPSNTWFGHLEVHGGYIIVREDGEVVCYHIYNWNEFKEYLLENTKFETPSSKRHNFGKIYQKDDELFFNLNLQIRFLK